MRKKLKIFKKTYLALRTLTFAFFSVFTFPLRKINFSKESTRRVLVIALNRIGDAVVSIPTFRAIKESIPHSQLTVFVASYVKEILERIPDIDSIITHDKGLSFLKKVKMMRELSGQRFDLAVDLTCDYTLASAFLTCLSGAKYKVGYNIHRRAFLLNKPVKYERKPVHVIDEILNIVRSLGVGTQDKSLRISASPESIQTIWSFLLKANVREKDLLIGIHPGGYYPTQLWPEERFAAVADEVMDKYGAKVVLIGGSKEEAVLQRIKNIMRNKPLIFLNPPLRDLLALIQSCHLLVCNNSGPLHMAVALDTPTVSTMGPTIPERWRPHGQGHIVIRKDLPCSPCDDGSCRVKTHECMMLITVDDVFEAVERQLSKITRNRR